MSGDVVQTRAEADVLGNAINAVLSTMPVSGASRDVLLLIRARLRHFTPAVPQTEPPERTAGEDLIAATEAARVTGISPRAMRKRIARGQVPATKIAGVWMIPRAALAEPEDPDHVDAQAG